jgi:hypothetical protein
MPQDRQTCDTCGASWPVHWKCQIICPNCGAKQDCSDLFLDYERVERERRRPLAEDRSPDKDAPR